MPIFAWKRRAAAAAALAALAASAVACGNDEPSAREKSPGVVTVAAHALGARPVAVRVPAVAAIRAELPAAIRNGGRLVIGVGCLPTGWPPVAYVGTDQRTLAGSDPDLGRLVAAVLGLRPELQNASWENMFIGTTSGRFHVDLSGITVTEERKRQGYAFASYRQDILAFEVGKADPWTFTGDFHALAGRTVSVDAGTNQEKILRGWQRRLQAEGKSLTIRYFGDQNSRYLALDSGRINTYFTSNPGIAYHVAQTAGTPHPTRTAGTYSGGGATVQGLIGAMTKKDNGLAKPLADAIDYLIGHGQYATLMSAYNLSNEVVKASRVDPPGLPESPAA